MKRFLGLGHYGVLEQFSLEGRLQMMKMENSNCETVRDSEARMRAATAEEAELRRACWKRMKSNACCNGP
jgi:hypothetical protein